MIGMSSSRYPLCGCSGANTGKRLGLIVLFLFVAVIDKSKASAMKRDFSCTMLCDRIGSTGTLSRKVTVIPTLATTATDCTQERQHSTDDPQCHQVQGDSQRHGKLPHWLNIPRGIQRHTNSSPNIPQYTQSPSNGSHLWCSLYHHDHNTCDMESIYCNSTRQVARSIDQEGPVASRARSR